MDLIAGRNVIVTVHAQPMQALAEFEAHIDDVAVIGRLDAAAFLAAIVDTALASFRRQVEAIEHEIDRLDELALAGRDPAGFLQRVVQLRRRTGALRRLLVPQREAFIPLTRPDFELQGTKSWVRRGQDSSIGSSGRSRSHAHASSSSAHLISTLGARRSALG